MIRRVKEHTETELQKIADIETNLPSWDTVSTYINNIDSIPKARAAILKIARVVYWLAKNKST